MQEKSTEQVPTAFVAWRVSVPAGTTSDLRRPPDTDRRRPQPPRPMNARDQIAKAAAEHGWDATIETELANEYRKGDFTLFVYFHPDGRAQDVTYFRGDIGLAHLAPADTAVDSALRWLAGQRA